MTVLNANTIAAAAIAYGCTATTANDGKGGVSLTISKPGGHLINGLMNLPQNSWSQIILVSASIVGDVLLSVVLD